MYLDEIWYSLDKDYSLEQHKGYILSYVLRDKISHGIGYFFFLHMGKAAGIT